MRKSAALCLAFFALVPALVLACKKDDIANNATTPNGMASGGYGAPQGYGQPGAYPQQPGAYPQQPGAYPQQPGAYPQQPGAYPQGQQPLTPGTVPGAAPASTLAVPGPAALPCSNDSMCMTHRCNVQYGKCAFPCASDADCIQGAYCFKSAISTCLPKPPGQ